MSELRFKRDGWIEGDLDDADERATFTRLTVVVGNTVVTRAFRERGGGETDALNVPLLPLARFIARMWWPLLYEAPRRGGGGGFAGRHRLDASMHGYVFPAVAICSAGDEAVLVDWKALGNDYSPLKFLASSPAEPLQIGRGGAEPPLMDVVESVLERMHGGSSARRALCEDWWRVRESLEAPAQTAYCKAAGRLGIDPFSPDAPEIDALAHGLSEGLFGDLADVSWVSEVGGTADWVRGASGRLGICPEVDVSGFDSPPKDDLQVSAGELGYHVAVNLRDRLGLALSDPRKAVDELLGGAVGASAVLAGEGPVAVTALVHRTNGVARIGTIARSARQRRFRACAAAYVAWCSEPGDYRAGTVAFTRRQQAGRAFAAEMLAPREYLSSRAKKGGFTEEELEEVAGDLIAPHDTVLWQAWRGGVPLWDVDLPAPRPSFFF